MIKEESTGKKGGVRPGDHGGTGCLPVQMNRRRVRFTHIYNSIPPSVVRGTHPT